jgi:CHAT domain-containing protein
MKKINIVWIQHLVFISFISIIAFGCAGTSLNERIKNDTEIKSLKTYKNISVGKWENTKIPVDKGDAVILVPLYPKGFIYPVKGKIGDSSESFEALDVDSGDIYKAKTSGTLQIGIEHKTRPIRSGIFVFNNGDLDTIISDLIHIHTRIPKSKIINLALANLFKQKSEILLTKNSNDEALTCIRQAIEFFKNTDAKMYSGSISRLYRLTATLYKMKGNLERFRYYVNLSMESLMIASKYYQKLALSNYAFLSKLNQEERFLLLTKTNYFKKTAWKDADDPRFGHNFTNLPDAYRFIAKHYARMGDLRQSLSYCQKAIDEAKNNGNRDLIARAYGSLGFRHINFGFWDLAEKAFLTSLDYCKKSSEWNRFRLIKGLVYTRTGMKKFDSAEKMLKNLARGVPTLLATGRPLQINYMLAILYMDQGEYEKAIPKFKRLYTSFSFWEGYGGGSKASFIRAGLYLSECYFQTGRIDDAVEMIKKIEQDLENLGSPIKVELQARLIKSKIMKRVGGDHIAPLIGAISSLEEIRPTASSNSDYEYWERMLSVYDEAIEALSQHGETVQALEVVQKARSRRFLDYLGSKKLGVKGSAGYLLNQQADGILESLSIIENDMIQAAQNAGIKIRSIYQEGTRYTKRLENYRNTLKDIARIDPQFGAINNATPASPLQIQKKIPNTITIIEYYLSDTVLYVWVIDHQNINGWKLDISRDRIKDMILALRNSLSVDTADRGIKLSKKNGADITKKEQELYDLLFLPIEKYIQTDKISFVPYGILNYLPFQALYDGNQYLIEKYSINYIPSLSTIQFLKKSAKKDSLKILAFGNPDLNDKTLDLPAAEKEVEMIKAIFPATTIFKRKKATEDIAKELTKDYDIIHFASHGEYIPTAPLASCIRLSPGNGEDGRLEASEIFDMDIEAVLVVTSACQTAIGQIGRGDEIVGLTRAFIYAGANSVLGSLWNISDEATAVLMKEFYANIKNLDSADALRQAQLKMINSKDFNHPYYWAAFNITGGL